MRWYITIAMAALSTTLAGCEPGGPKSSRGFTLPEGDAELGQATFAELSCHACHTVSGIELPALEGESKMKNYNDVLTVKQLIDLVAFLQSRYELQPYEPTDYPVYPMF